MAITDLDEQRLVRAHQAGDEQAFGQIVRSQHRGLYAHAYRRLGSHEAAEDAVQDTLLRAYRALPSLDGDLRLRAWLHRILTNVCHDESNRRRRQLGLIDKLEAQPLELEPDPIEETVLHDTVRVMNEALTQLPDSYREALVLRYVDGLSFREVAAATGISEENARARVHRGRLALNKILSRVAVVVAFLVPGMRRTQKAIITGGDAAVSTGGTEQAVSLSTQLAAHLTQAAPVLSRVAAEGSTFMAAKSSVVATAVAAVAAVSAPVVAYQVYETQRTPARPPSAVGAPAIAEPELDAGATATSVRDLMAERVTADDATSASTTTTTSTLPPSAARPFIDAPAPAAHAAADEPPETTTTTSTPAPEPGAVDAWLGGGAFEIIGERPDFDIGGRAVLSADDGELAGVLGGSLYVADDVGEDVSAELTFTLDDGRTYRVRFRGTLIEERDDGDGTVWTGTGQYSVPDGSSISMPETGGARLEIDWNPGRGSSVRFGFVGDQSS